MTEPPMRRVVAPSPADRLPPGQIVTRKWPVLHYSHVPRIDTMEWRFEVAGLVNRPLSLSWEDLAQFGRQETVCDIHCVTRWSRYDNNFVGVPVRAILNAAGVKPEAKHVMIHAAPDYATNLPLDDLDREENLLATHHNGEPLAPEHGGPIRLLVPHLYFWKSAKWVTGFELLDAGWPGFWEENGYHMRGDPRGGSGLLSSALMAAPLDRQKLEALADGKVEDILRAAASWAKEVPTALTPAIRAVCVRLSEMVADQRHYLAPLPEPQETERAAVLTLTAERLRATRVAVGIEGLLQELADIELRATGSWSLVEGAQAQWIATAVQFLEAKSAELPPDQRPDPYWADDVVAGITASVRALIGVDELHARTEARYSGGHKRATPPEAGPEA